MCFTTTGRNLGYSSIVLQGYEIGLQLEPTMATDQVWLQAGRDVTDESSRLDCNRYFLEAVQMSNCWDINATE